MTKFYRQSSEGCPSGRTKPVRAPGCFTSFLVVLSFHVAEHWRNMERANLSRGIEFELLGLTSDPWLQRLLFMVFLGMYTITLLGHLIMFIMIHVECHLAHTRVLPSEEPLLLGFLLLLHSCPPDPGELLSQEEGDLLSRLHGSDVFLRGFCHQ